MVTRVYTSENAGKTVVKTALAVAALDHARGHLKNYEMTDQGFCFSLENQPLNKKAVVSAEGEPLNSIIEL